MPRDDEYEHWVPTVVDFDAPDLDERTAKLPVGSGFDAG